MVVAEADFASAVLKSCSFSVELFFLRAIEDRRSLDLPGCRQGDPHITFFFHWRCLTNGAWISLAAASTTVHSETLHLNRGHF